MLPNPIRAARGPAAADIGSLMWMLVAIGGAVFIVFVYFFVRALLREERDDRGHGRKLIIWGGLVVPALVVSVVLGATLLTMRNLPGEAGEDAVVIEVVGHQWWWEVYYPQYDIRSANEIQIPIDRQVELRLSSADVVHSFWVPALGGKLDLLPDRENVMVLEASEPDVYRGVCAEFCGLQHAKMAFRAVATTELEHWEWVERASQPAEEPDTRLASRGLQVLLDAGCQECHAIDGTEVDGLAGPNLTHIASRESIAAGSLDNTTENLADWITNPQLLKPGVKMPDIELDAADVEALVAYLETLE